MKLLLVEDSKFMRMTNERALVRAGHQVFSAPDGEEAVRLARAHIPDMILLDMLLPKLSGPEVLKRLKADASTAGIPVVVVTSLSQKNEAKLLEEGASAFLEKSSLTLDRGAEAFVTAIERIAAQLAGSKPSKATR